MGSDFQLGQEIDWEGVKETCLKYWHEEMQDVAPEPPHFDLVIDCAKTMYPFFQPKWLVSANESWVADDIREWLFPHDDYTAEVTPMMVITLMLNLAEETL